MNNSWFTVRQAALALLCLGIVPGFAQESGERSGAEQLAAILHQTETLSADVEQLMLDQDGREMQETKARLLMRKPAAFRWEVTEPWEELTVTNGSVVWRYEPDLEQVTIKYFNEAVDRTPVMLLNSDAKTIAEAYTVSASYPEDGDIAHFVLHPRHPDSLFERLSLSFTGVELLEMQFENSLGQFTSLSFRDLQRNQPLDAALFEFTPPAGVEVIDTTTGLGE